MSNLSVYAVEVNVHTNEKRFHTAQTLEARLVALKVLAPGRASLPNLPLSSPHACFRRYMVELDPRPQPILFALPDGSWGGSTEVYGCTLCHGSGRLNLKDSYRVECWECNGTGKVSTFHLDDLCLDATGFLGGCLGNWHVNNRSSNC